MKRSQLTAYSPVTTWSVFKGAQQLLRVARDRRADLENWIRKEYEAPVAILFGSGTQALTAAILEAQHRTGSSEAVALPAYSCFDLASAAIGADVNVRFYDVDPASISPDLESLERVMRDGARTIVIAPLFGIPVDWPAIDAVAKKYGAIVIEDAAQGSGAMWHAQKLGQLGEISTLSFGRAKGWTGGSGGALLLRDNAATARLLERAGAAADASDLARIVAQLLFGRPSMYAIPSGIPALHLGQTTYRPPRSPRSISRVAASALLATALASAREAQRRKLNAKRLLQKIAGIATIKTFRVNDCAAPGFLRLPIRLPAGVQSLANQNKARALGIAPGYPQPLSDLRQLSGRRVDRRSTFPGASILVRELITLPTHSMLSEKDTDDIATLLRS